MKKEYIITRHGFKKKFLVDGKSIPLYTYLCGLPDVDLMTVALAGEDFQTNTLMISIWDLPDYLKQGARLNLKMDKKDLELIKNFIDNQ